MAYTINKSDGTVLTTIIDGTVDTTTDLSLIGKKYSGYGEAQNENFVKLLENFSNTTANAPSNPLTGQLFFDSSLGQVQVYNGSVFKAIASSIVSTSAPASGVQGDTWYDSANDQLKVYSGSAWLLVGPTASSTTGGISDSITDSTGVSRPVVRLKANNETVGIVSNVGFTPATAITGFASITAGVTLSTNITGIKLTGTATDSDALGGVAAANFLRSDTADTMSGTLTISADTSLTLGADGDVTMSQDGATFTIRNATQDGDLKLNVNDGGVNTAALTCTGSDGSVTIANNLTVSGNHTVSGTFTASSGTATVNNLTVNGNLQVDGTTTTVNTSTVQVEDNILTLNSGVSGAPSSNSGIEVERGTGTNVTFLWDETADKWTIGTETLVAGTVEGDLTGDVTGNITGNVTGNVTATTVSVATINSDDSTQVTVEDGLTVTGTVIMMANLPTSDPGNAGQLYNDSGTVKVSTG